METLKINYDKKLPKNYTGIIEYPNGSIFYYLNGKRHREDGPAIIRTDGTLEYFLNGFYHREDGPAVINEKGEFYFLNDINITDEVNDWIKENNIPEIWNNSHKTLFKLTFG